MSVKGSPFFTFSRKPTKPDVPKRSRLWIFSALQLFSEIFLMSQCPLRVFWYFATECMLINPKGSPFTFFGTVRHFPKEFFFENFHFFQKVLRFLSLRYSADFRRSRLVQYFNPFPTPSLHVRLCFSFQNYISGGFSSTIVIIAMIITTPIGKNWRKLIFAPTKMCFQEFTKVVHFK